MPKKPYSRPTSPCQTEAISLEATALQSLQACIWTLPTGRFPTLSLVGVLPPVLAEFATSSEAWTSLVFPSDRLRFTTWLSAVSKGRCPDPLEYRLTSESAGIVWVRQSAFSLKSTKPANPTKPTGQGTRPRGLLAVISREKELEAECLRVCERERASIGQELHDDLCQLLAGMSCMVDVLAKQVVRTRPELHSEFDDLAAQLHHGMDRTRALSHGLVPARLVEAGLAAALTELARQTRLIRRADVRLSLPKVLPLHSAEQTLHLYRIAQEAIGNALRHGQASRVTLSVRCAKGLCTLAVSDNGRGLPACSSDQVQGIGLHVMRYRADILGARFCLRSRPGKGVMVSVRYPSPPQPDTATR